VTYRYKGVRTTGPHGINTHNAAQVRPLAQQGDGFVAGCRHRYAIVGMQHVNALIEIDSAFGEQLASHVVRPHEAHAAPMGLIQVGGQSIGHNRRPCVASE
jgi:hypothetical protein